MESIQLHPVARAYHMPHVENAQLFRLFRTLVLLTLPMLGMSACSKHQGTAVAAEHEPPPEVSSMTIHAKTLPADFEYVGQTAGSRETEVRARISGILQNRLYEEGVNVKAGQALFQIDPGAYQTQLASVEANAAVAEAKLNQARRELERLTPLAAEKAISQKEFDDARSTLETAEAGTKQSRAQVNEARLNLGYTKVMAPIGGVTGVAIKSNGSLITQTDSLLTTIVQTDPMYIRFSVPESDFLKLNKDLNSGALSLDGKRAANGSLGFSVSIKLADGSIYPVSGKMNFSSERINPATGGFDARAQVANPNGNLRPGQFVRVMLSGASLNNAIAIPQRAVLDAPKGKMVLTVGPENKLVPRPVELDGLKNGTWIVTKGLQEGDRIVVDGLFKAKPGMAVNPVEATSIAKTSSSAPSLAAPAAGAAR
ncbi:efflux RND transporter periplasmic adaptor subunit [Undibacterium sp. Ji83W]|uniref:efflux RND transporter periplasmic adaptor subunit n=1 Tax=Undibacterium sp. Ji83W TaxID=3413043 RepID=UPI003BF38BE1